MTSMRIVQFPRPPTPLVRLYPKFFHPLDLGRPVSNELPTPNDNQSINGKYNPMDGCYMLSGLSFRSPFVFSINSLILSGVPLTFFHLVEANLVPRSILKIKKLFFVSPYSEKMG